MLILHRKSSQGVEVKNKVTGETHEIDYLYLDGDNVVYRHDGSLKRRHNTSPFYVDKAEEMLVRFFVKDGSLRIGLDAPKHWNIRRKEIAETA